MAQWIKAPPAQIDDLSSISKTHVVEQETGLLQIDLHSSLGTYAHTLIN